jgi:uncharacterized protein
MLLVKKALDLVEQLGLIPHPEGGFFLETFRSGCEPMSTRGQSDPSAVQDTHQCLVVRWHEPDIIRHALTSIYWMPTLASPRLVVCINRSPHVHYYQGGRPFHYILYHPETRTLQTMTLGPDLQAGHVLQVPVLGGWWKAGYMTTHHALEDYDYTLIGEGVGPGFDFVDMTMLEESDLQSHPLEIQETFRPYLHTHIHSSVEALSSDKQFDDYYEANELQQQRIEERIKE